MIANLGTVDTEGARHALQRGGAVVLPNPAPLTYTVAATDPHAVNAAKGRPADQAVALWAHHPGTLTVLYRTLDLDARLAAVAHRLLCEELVTLLVPLHEADKIPDWLSPASKDGWTLLFGARWTPLRCLLADFPILYVSSANLTGHPPAATAADAIATFPITTAVLGSSSLTDIPAPPDSPRRATTTLRLHPDGQIDLHRRGAQDQLHGCPEQYLDYIRTTYTTGTR